MTTEGPLTTADTRIHITRRTARWDHRPATTADAMDFWSFAAGAANVVMQLSLPGVGYGVVESKVESGNPDEAPLETGPYHLQLPGGRDPWRPG